MNKQAQDCPQKGNLGGFFWVIFPNALLTKAWP